MEWIDLVWYGVMLAAGLLIGYVVGAKRARRVKKRVQLELNVQSLELLDAKSSLNSMLNYLSQHQRKDRLLNLSLRKLQQAQSQVNVLSNSLSVKDNKHFIEQSRLKLQAAEAREVAVKAAAIARKATIHLKRLEEASPATQTIEAPEPKSYGCGDPVTVSVVDQAKLDIANDTVNAVTNRDSARLSKLHSSNEATATL